MRIAKLDITIKSPLHIGDLVLSNVFKHSHLDYLPPSTVKGVLLSKLYIDYGYKEVVVESENPSISIRPAYPVFNGVEARPSHPMVYKCKLCKEDEKIFLDESFSSIDSIWGFRYDRVYFPYKCRNGHLYSVTRADELLIFDVKKKKYKAVSIDTTQFESIGINRGLGNTEVGMLYSYTAIKPGVRFRTMLCGEGNMLDKVMDELPRRDKYLIGRGGSRGMGVAEIVIEEIDSEDYLGKRANDIREVIEKSRGLVILLSISPINIGFKGYKIDLRNYNLREHIVYEYNNHTYNYIPNGVLDIKGWSIRNKLPKLTVKALSPGSIYFYESIEKDNLDKLSRRLAELELRGFAPPYNLGFNYLEVYSDVKYIL